MSESVQKRDIFGKMTAALDEMGWKYDKDEAHGVVRSGVNIGDYYVNLVMVVKERNDVIQLLAKLPFSAGEDYQVDTVMALAVANYGLIDGSFDFDFNGRNIFFRLSACVKDCEMGGGLIKYIITTAASTVEHYISKFADIACGKLALETFMDEEKN